MAYQSAGGFVCLFVFVVVHSLRIETVMAGKAWQLEDQVIAFTVRKQRFMWTHH